MFPEENDRSSGQGHIIHGATRRKASRSLARKKKMEFLVGGAVAIAGLITLVGLVIFLNTSSEQIQRKTNVTTEDATTIALGFLVLGVLALVYFMPTFVAVFRKHHNAAAIVILNILTGWSFVGWVAALVWSFTEIRTKDHYHFHQYGPPPSSR
jgi:cytochrome bd-type quinol oxidase subunit 2